MPPPPSPVYHTQGARIALWEVPPLPFLFKGCPLLPLPLLQVVREKCALMLGGCSPLPLILAARWGFLPPDQVAPLHPLTAHGRRALPFRRESILIPLYGCTQGWGSRCLFHYPIPVSIPLVSLIPMVSPGLSPLPWGPCGWVARWLLRRQ